jgi:2-oxoglutarate dehydrogenase E2 component (dihydrolipoamide succinyltransferase)
VAELETDKVDVELPSPASGVLASITAREGEAVPVGGVIGTIEESTAGDGQRGAAEPVAPEEPPAKQPPAKEPPVKEPPVKEPPPAKRPPARKEPPPVERPRQEPPARQQPPRVEPEPEEPTRKEPPPEEPPGRAEETVPMTAIRRRIAKRLVEAQLSTALTTTFNELDMTAVQDLRRDWRGAFEERHGVRLGLMSFFVKAAVDALRRYPKFNARIDGDSIVFRSYQDIGIAVATERGLVVPVIRNAEGLSFALIEQAIEDLARRARAGELEVEDLVGGTFTITNGGVFGSLLSVPLVNPPQTAVLGLHAIQDRPVARDGQVVIRPMMYVALTYDHRLVDGAEAVTFLRRVKDTVEEPARLLLES